MNNHREVKYKDFVWIDITHPQKDQLEELAKENDLDYFLISDSLEHGHLPKIEKLTDYTFIILRAFTGKRNDKNSTVSELSNKIAFFYNDHKIITIHKANFDFVEQINQEFRSTYQLLLFIVNKMINTFVPPSEWHSNMIDEVEKVVFLKDQKNISLEDLYYQKSQTRIIKKLLQISQDVVNKILVDKASASALQDVKDKIVSLILIYDEAAEDAHNLMNTYLSVTAGKNNDVMKLLTIFSAFFLPLTFIVGVYGMNFDFMPELHWKYGYLWVVVLMVFVCLIIFYWFRKKKII